MNKPTDEEIQFAEYCSLSDYIYHDTYSVWFCNNDDRPQVTTKQLYAKWLRSKIEEK